MSHLVYIFQIGIGFENFLKDSNFGGLPPSIKIFGDHVQDRNLGTVTKFGYHSITGVDSLSRVKIW